MYFRQLNTFKCIALIGILFITGMSQADIKIENSYYQVAISEESYSFTVTRKGMDDCNIQKGVMSSDIISVERVSINDPIFGRGKALDCIDKDGSITRAMLFESVPFIAIRKSLSNKTSKQTQIDKCPIVSLDVSFDRPSNELMTRGTAGLKELGEEIGSYVFAAIADPDTGHGVISAWVSFDRGSGVVFYGLDGDTAKMSSRIDYGDLRLDPSQTEQGELLFVGLFEDVRFGLEQFAEGVKLYNDIKLRDLPSTYCTWYHARSSDEKRLAQNTDFVDGNLKQYGLSVMQIDDRWQLGQFIDGPKKVFESYDPKGPYPSGMKATADNIKKHGLVPGIWFMPFSGSFTDPYFADKQNLFYKVGQGSQSMTRRLAKEAEMEIKDIEQMPYAVRWGGTCIDMTNPQSQEYLHQIVNRLSREWGYEYFKMDGLWAGTGTDMRYHNNEYKDDGLGKPLRFDPMVTPIEAYRKGLEVVRDAAGDDVFFLGCCMIQNQRTFGGSFGRLDAMRVGPDNGTSKDQLIRGPMFSTRYYFLNKRVWHNDPDPMYFRPTISLDSAKIVATWVTLSGALGASSEDYYNLPQGRLDVLKRTMPSHTSKESRPLDFMQSEVSYSWILKDDSSGVQRMILGHYNWDKEKTKTIETKLSKIGLDSTKQYIGFDYWNNKFIAPFSGSIKSALSPFSCRDIAIYPVKDHPQLISTSRHITQGIVDVNKESWSRSQLKLTCNVIANESYEMCVAVPTGKSWIIKNAVIKNAPKAAKCSFVQDGPNIRVTLHSPETGEIELALKFKKGQVSQPKPVEIVELSATRYFDKVKLNWKTVGNGSGFKIIRNDGIATSINGCSFTDYDVENKKGYTYQLKALDVDGNTVENKMAGVEAVIMDLLPLPPKPDMSITSLKPIGGIEDGGRKAQKNKSHSGKKLIIDGVEYDDGYGVHANTSMRFKIPKGAKRFVAVVGIDGAMKNRDATSIRFKVIGDMLEMGETPAVLAKSPVLAKSTMSKWYFDIELDERLRELVLVVEDGGDGNNSDHADWCNAGFIKTGQ